MTMKIYLGDGPIMDKESVDSLVDAHVEQHGVNGITWSIVALSLHGNASDIRRQRELWTYSPKGLIVDTVTSAVERIR